MINKIDKAMIIQLQGGVIHFVDETNLGEECVIYSLYVDEDYRHQRLGSQLVKLALDYIFRHGYKKAFLVIKDKSLISFYKSLGSVRVGKNEMYFYN